MSQVHLQRTKRVRGVLALRTSSTNATPVAVFGVGHADQHGLFVQATLCDVDENCAFTRRELFKSRPEGAEGLFVVAASAVTIEPQIHCIQKILIPERLG